MKRFMLELVEAGRHLRGIEPTADEVTQAAPRLASFYNEPHNRAMLAHEDQLSVSDVRAHYRALAAERAHAFLLDLDGLLVGDADLRGIDGQAAEAAILIGERSIQGQGLGTLFAVMLHAFGFRSVGLRRLYASIIPTNTASLRLFGKLGYERDDSLAARRTIDDPDDITLSLTAERFEEFHGALAARARITERSRRRND